MGLSDVVAGNITTVYLAVIVAVRAYSFVSGHVLGGLAMVAVASAVVGFILVAALVWDVGRKAGKVATRVRERGKVATCVRERGACRGGICWHGVAVRFPAAQVRFRIPQNL